MTLFITKETFLKAHERFTDAIRQSTGGAPSEVMPGKMTRFATSDRRGDEAGWCKLFDDGEGGVFGCWRQGISETWQARETHSPEEKRAFAKHVQQARVEAQRLEEHQRTMCREKSAELWDRGRDADAKHAYLLAKGVKPHGLKQLRDTLMVPVRDTAGTLHGIQFIQPDGGKRFKTGTAVAGCYHAIGGKPNGKIIVCEGYATGSTIHEVTDGAVAIAFNAGNLKPVAEALRTKYPDVEIVVCADDDRLTEGNPGLARATEAAQAVGGKLAVPALPDTRGVKDSDFNDLARLCGTEAVRASIEAARVVPPITAENPAAGESESLKPGSRVHIVNVFDFMSIEFPPRENLLAPWLPVQGLAMVYAPRGIGKTHFSLGVAYAVSSGGEFLGWQATRPASVLFIDGEMPAVTLQKRIALINLSSQKDPAAPFKIITPDLQNPLAGMIDLSRPTDQRELEPALDGVDLIILDNLSTLCRSGKESEGEGWLPVQSWVLRQRAAGRSVLLVHHSGKNGEQRGTSRREDVLDTVIALRRPADYTPDRGANFEVHFEKARGIFGDDTKPFEVQLNINPSGLQEWTIKNLDKSTAEKVAALLDEGLSQTEVAEMLKLTRGAVSKARKKAGELGLLKGVS